MGGTESTLPLGERDVCQVCLAFVPSARLQARKPRADLSRDRWMPSPACWPLRREASWARCLLRHGPRTPAPIDAASGGSARARAPCPPPSDRALHRPSACAPTAERHRAPPTRARSLDAESRVLAVTPRSQLGALPVAPWSAHASPHRRRIWRQRPRARPLPPAQRPSASSSERVRFNGRAPPSATNARRPQCAPALCERACKWALGNAASIAQWQSVSLVN